MCCLTVDSPLMHHVRNIIHMFVSVYISPCNRTDTFSWTKKKQISGTETVGQHLGSYTWTNELSSVLLLSTGELLHRTSTNIIVVT